MVNKRELHYMMLSYVFVTLVKFNILTLQGSAAPYLRCREKYYMAIIVMFVSFQR